MIRCTLNFPDFEQTTADYKAIYQQKNPALAGFFCCVY